jgi:hypothetical protein
VETTDGQAEQTCGVKNEKLQREFDWWTARAAYQNDL